MKKKRDCKNPFLFMELMHLSTKATSAVARLPRGNLKACGIPPDNLLACREKLNAKPIKRAKADKQSGKV